MGRVYREKVKGKDRNKQHTKTNKIKTQVHRKNTLIDKVTYSCNNYI